jgi:outer membrane protein assembly factor BamB
MSLAVVPILVGPLQVLLALLPAMLLALGGALLALFKPSTAKQSLKLLWRLKAPLLLLFALGFGLVQAVRAMLPKPKVAPTEAGAADWPLFRGSPQRAGSISGSAAPLAGGVNWAFKSDLKTFYSSPAVVGNRLFVTGADKGVFTDRGAVYCLDADTGGLVWKARPDNFRASFSSPSVNGRFLVVGEGLHYTSDSRVFCLDLTQQGKVLWSYRTTNHVESTACLSQGRAYVGAGDDGYYCFALEPETNGRARVLWHAATDRCPDAETSPVLYESKVFIGLGMRGNALVCLEAETGRELWRVPTPYPVFTPPTVWSNRVFFGMGNGNFIETAPQAAAKELAELKAAGATEAQLSAAAGQLKAGGEVWCVDLAKPETVLWKFKTSEVVLGAVAVSGDGTLAFGTRGGEFFALTADGRELARRQVQVPILTSPAVTSNHVYFVTENGRLYALERRTLATAWETSLGATGPFLSSPTIAHGHVYVGSQEDGLLCLGHPATSEKALVWAGAQGGPGRPGHVDDSPLPERGALVWRWPPASGGGDESPPVPRITAPAALLGDLIAVPIAAGARCGLLALTNDAKTRVTPGEKWFYATTNGVWQSPALARAPSGRIRTPSPGAPASAGSEGSAPRGALWPPSAEAGVPGIERGHFPPSPAATVSQPPDHDASSPSAGPLLAFLVDGKVGDANRRLHCLDARTGLLRWRVPVGADASGEFVVIDESLVVQRGRQEVACFDFNGQPRWQRPLGALRGVAAGGNDLAVVALASAPRLLALDLPTGHELWDVEVEAVTGPVVDGGTVFLGTTNGLSARRLTDGSPLWQATIAPPAQPLMVEGSTLAAITRSNELVLLDAKSGRVQTVTPGALAGLPPLLTRDAVLFAAKDALMRVPFSQPKPQKWIATAWLGELSAPMVMAESAVYFATPAKGFIKTGRLK